MESATLPRATKPVQKLVFMGSPAFAVPSLQLLVQHFEITAVYCQPPRPAGRGQQFHPTPVQRTAEALNLPVLHPEKLKGEALEVLLATDADVFCVVAYGLLLPKALVEQNICLNVHPSSLPRWRGAAPLNHTLLAGDATSEVCVMQLDAGMDTGPVFARSRLPLMRTTTLGELHDSASQIGAQLLLQTLQQLPKLVPIPQSGEPTHAAKIKLADRLINWSQPAARIHDQIRGLAPVPGAFFVHQHEQIKALLSEEVAAHDFDGAAPGTVLNADEANGLVIACGNNQSLRLQTVQRPGRKALSAVEALRGWSLVPGEKLGA